MNNNHQIKNPSLQDNRPVMVHSTHSNMETFDQATREQENGIRLSGADTMATQSAAGSAAHHGQDQHRQLQEATTGVQLDRDVLKSRRIAADSAKVGDHLYLFDLTFYFSFLVTGMEAITPTNSSPVFLNSPRETVARGRDPTPTNFHMPSNMSLWDE